MCFPMVARLLKAPTNPVAKIRRAMFLVDALVNTKKPYNSSTFLRW